MKNLLIAFIASAALFSCSTPTIFSNEDSQALRHVVLFQWADSITPEKKAELIAHFGSLKEKIGAIKDFEYGEDISVEGLTKGYTHCFIVTFADTAARNTYLPHPDHKAFGDSVVPYLKNVLVVDYITNK